MADERLRVGIVGAGAIASVYARVFERSAEAAPAGVADVDAGAAGALAAQLGCEHFTSHEALGEAVAPDAVVVCTPPASHPEIACHFLERGVPVLSEKPLAIDLVGATRMLEAAKANHVVLTMAAKYRFVPDVTEACHMAHHGDLGEIVLVENAFTSRVAMAGRWNARPAIGGGGVLIDNGTHSIDVIRYLLGPVAEVLAVEGKRTQRLPVEETVRLALHAAVDGVLANVDLSWSIDKSLDDFLQIYGTEGEVRVGWRRSLVRAVGDDAWRTFGTGYDKVESMRGAFDNFCGAIRGREQLVTSAEDALASVAVIDAAYRSMRTRTWAPVEVPMPYRLAS